MSLVKFEVSDLRNIESARLDPSPRMNFIVGPNAGGKTSLLEAIYLLGRARSFRTRDAGRLIRLGQKALTVAGRVSGAAGGETLGLRIGRGLREIHRAGRPVDSSAELIQAFPVLVIHPAGIALLEGAPKLRRQFLDFGAFHQDPAHLQHWRRYAKALSQRNALIRAQRPAELPLWTRELAQYGTIVAEARRRYAERLEPLFLAMGARFFEGHHFTLHLQAGWDSERDLAGVLEADSAADLRHGYTQSGPHKADFSIALDNRPARAYLSRGQMKLLVYALLLAQSRLMEDQGKGCVLIDDVASELDDDNRRTLLGVLREGHGQFFITATARTLIEESLDGDAALFRMEQGRAIQT